MITNRSTEYGEQILALWRQNLSYNQIALELNLSKGIVAGVIHRARAKTGIARRRPGPSPDTPLIMENGVSLTDEGRQHAIELYKDGHSRIEIASAIGSSYDVVRKVIRRHLANEAFAARQAAKAAAPPPPPPPTPEVRPQPAPRPVTRPVPIINPFPPSAPWSGEPIPILDLRLNSCRYIVTSRAPHLYCGAPKRPGKWCCREHYAVCYTPSVVSGKRSARR